MYAGIRVKYALFLSDFTETWIYSLDLNETWIFSTDSWKNIQIQNFIKVRAVVAELFHADRRTDMTKLTVAFRNFDNEPETWITFLHNVRKGPLFLKQTILLSLLDFNQNWNIYRSNSLNLSPWRSVSQSRFTSRTHSVPEEFNEYLIPFLVLSRHLYFVS